MMNFNLNLDAKRAAALVLAPGLLAVGGDAAIAHFAGRDMAHPAQLLPAVIGPLACCMLAAGAASEKWFGRAARGVGALVTLLGTVGTGFHARALGRLLAGSPLTRENLATALAVAPPIFAPGAFVLMGALVYALGSERITLQLHGAKA